MMRITAIIIFDMNGHLKFISNDINKLRGINIASQVILPTKGNKSINGVLIYILWVGYLEFKVNVQVVIEFDEARIWIIVLIE